jgi:hypothetical protein
VVERQIDSPDFPGVHEAVRELDLKGRQRGTLFVHEVC